MVKKASSEEPVRMHRRLIIFFLLFSCNSPKRSYGRAITVRQQQEEDPTGANAVRREAVDSSLFKYASLAFAQLQPKTGELFKVSLPPFLSSIEAQGMTISRSSKGPDEDIDGEGEKRHHQRKFRAKQKDRSKRADDDMEGEGEKRHHQRKFRPKPKEEEKKEEPEAPKYRDRAKERREDQNPDYEHTATELGSLHAVAPPGTVDLRMTEAHRISIENSKFLGGDVEHTHLVKGLDYALLHKVRSEIDKRPEDENEEDSKHRSHSEETSMVFRTSSTKLIYQWLVKPQAPTKANEMFLPGRTAFVYDLDEEFFHDIPTTVHRSKADCPPPQEMVTVGVDGSVLERIAKIMTYLRLGASGKILKKKKKEKNGLSLENGGNERMPEGGNVSAKQIETGNLPPPPPLPPLQKGQKQEELKGHIDDDDIFQGAGVDYVTIAGNPAQSPLSEDMEESPRESQQRPSYFTEPGYGPAPPPPTNQDYLHQANYDGMQGPLLPAAYSGEWQEYPAAPPETYAGPWLPDQLPYPDQYLHSQVPDYSMQVAPVPAKDPRFMTQEEKDRGFGSVFKRDDQRLQQRREMDVREKDPNFISASYSECYPGYQEYNREIVDSDEDEDLTKMDMGGRAKGRLHRWDFETEEDWAKYNEQKEAMPKAAFQFGVKMQDGRKTRKQNKDQKLNNELHKINQIIDRKKKEKSGAYDDAGHFDEEIHTVKRLRV